MRFLKTVLVFCLLSLGTQVFAVTLLNGGGGPGGSVVLVTNPLDHVMGSQSQYRIYNTESYQVDRFSMCKAVSNNSGKDFLIPANSSIEWNLFAANPPVGVATGTCAVAISGSCGRASGNSYLSAAAVTAYGLCASGSPSVALTDPGPWTWTCSGLNGGGPSGSCSASIAGSTGNYWCPLGSASYADGVGFGFLPQGDATFRNGFGTPPLNTVFSWVLNGNFWETAYDPYVGGGGGLSTAISAIGTGISPDFNTPCVYNSTYNNSRTSYDPATANAFHFDQYFICRTNAADCPGAAPSCSGTLPRAQCCGGSWSSQHPVVSGLEQYQFCGCGNSPEWTPIRNAAGLWLAPGC